MKATQAADRDARNRHLIARDTLLPDFATTAIEAALEDGERREDLTERALRTTALQKWFTKDAEAGLQITDYSREGNVITATLADGSKWTLYVAIERVA